ncbi:MAG: sel1 repeat family protein [Lentisphaeria bacterium]|nr:sel1 repeat family protein [Lentisphaeria bacterium]
MKIGLSKLKIGFLCGTLLFVAVSYGENTAKPADLQPGIKLIQENKLDEAEKFFLGIAKNNNADALYFLGEIYLKKKSEKSLYAFKRAALLGNLEAKYKYAMMLADGLYTKQDIPAAIRLLKELSAKTDSPEVLFQIGRLLILTKGNPGLIEQYLKEAADFQGDNGEEGHPIAQLFLGILYAESNVYEKAYYYLELAAAAGDNPDALGKLGYLYAKGLGLEAPRRDWAIYCYLAKERIAPDAETEYNLGLLYGETGEYDEAIKWMKLAASKNYQTAKEFLNDKKELERIKAIQKNRSGKGNHLQSAFHSYNQKIRKQFGTDGQKVVEQLLGIPEIKDDDQMLLLPLKKEFKMAGWIYDPATAETIIENETMENREGDSLWMTDEFRKCPIEENLAAINPTIRAINHTYEETLVAALKKSIYKRLEKAEAEAILKKLDPDLVDSEMENAVWKLKENLYFNIHGDFTGRWQLRSYQFIYHDKDKTYLIAEFGVPPSPEDADMIAGVYEGDMDSLNNLAVKIAMKDMGTFFHDTDEAIEILKILAEKEHLTATYNLAILYQKTGNKEEAKKYLEMAKKLAAKLKK